MNSSPARITLVESEGCHFCEEAHRLLAELGARGDIELHAVDARSPEGLRLVGRYRPPMFPLVLWEDRHFSHGRLPVRKLAKRLAAHRDSATVA
ncbi:MAG TPA: glutaredoxin family protein [Marmoricola sp.]|nr:glutaredoxin family protein [Marmoricola sp.]